MTPERRHSVAAEAGSGPVGPRFVRFRRGTPPAAPRLRVRRLDLSAIAGPAERRSAVRAALRELLGETLGLAPADVPLAERPGRPALGASAGRPDLDMNCSTSGDVGLVAVVRRGRVGIDVQRILEEDVATACAEGWLADTERDRIAALPRHDQARALTRAWAQKEAVLKGRGVGLRADLAATLTLPGESGRLAEWFLAPVPVPPGYVACIAYRPLNRPSGIHDRLPIEVHP
jgi:4'-phosphopantetheinyl transferase